MKLIQPQNTVKIEGSLESSKVEIKEDAMDQLSILLRDKIYTDKVMSPIRELIANAADEHTKHNVKELVRIHLPTNEEPYFSVRDFGKGLSKKDVFGIFFTYFSSTKRDDKKLIGSWGLGSKSPYTLVNTFNVISYFEGNKSVYVGINLGRECESHLVSSELSDEPSGIEVSFEVKDIEKFRSKFAEFYQYFVSYCELEVINPVAFTPVDCKEGKIRPTPQNAIIFKGIRYQHDFEFIKGRAIEFTVPEHITLAIPPSREKLETVGINEIALRAFFDDYAAKMVKEFEDNFPSDLAWQWRVLSSPEISFYHQLGLDRKKYPAVRAYSNTGESYNFYSVSNGAVKKAKSYGFSWDTPVLFVNKKSVGTGLAQTIDETHKEDRILVFCQPSGEEQGRTFEEAQKILTEIAPYATLIDASGYIAARKPRTQRVIEEGLSAYSFKEHGLTLHKLNKTILQKKVYYTEALQGQLTDKNLNFSLARKISTKIPFFAVAKTNLKSVPAHWVNIAPIVKSIRRKINTEGRAEILQESLGEFQHYFKIEQSGNYWGIKPQRVKRKSKAALKKHLEGCARLAEMKNKDLEFNLYNIANQVNYYLPSQFHQEVKEKIKQKIKETYESVQ